MALCRFKKCRHHISPLFPKQKEGMDYLRRALQAQKAELWRQWSATTGWASLVWRVFPCELECSCERDWCWEAVSSRCDPGNLFSGLQRECHRGSEPWCKEKIRDAEWICFSSTSSWMLQMWLLSRLLPLHSECSSWKTKGSRAPPSKQPAE